MQKRKKRGIRLKKEWKFAFEKTIPVLAGYLSIGIAFGLLMQNMGYNVFWALLISLILYAGSMQFVLLQFLTGGTSLITVAIMTLLVNSRHLPQHGQEISVYGTFPHR